MKSISFNGEMIRAIQKGEKTQTRRPVTGKWLKLVNNVMRMNGECILHPTTLEDITTPFGVPGDKLWVRETWAQIWKDRTYCLYADEAGKCPCGGCKIEYKADSESKYPGEWDEDEAKGNDEAPKWRPSIHMPQWASRITLQIINIWVEKLQDISEKDICLEGIREEYIKQGTEMLSVGYRNYKDKTGACSSMLNNAKASFITLWNSIYDEKYPWFSNPWVGVIEFKKI